eukprot:scaffold254645_cov17-Prasinocladus_malaysianus.AAC.1
MMVSAPTRYQPPRYLRQSNHPGPTTIDGCNEMLSSKMKRKDGHYKWKSKWTCLPQNDLSAGSFTW